MILLLLAPLLAGQTAWGQQPAADPAPPAPAVRPVEVPPADLAGEIEALAKRLEDPTERRRLAAALHALLRSLPTQPATTTGPSEAVADAPPAASDGTASDGAASPAAPSTPAASAVEGVGSASASDETGGPAATGEPASDPVRAVIGRAKPAATQLVVRAEEAIWDRVGLVRATLDAVYEMAAAVPDVVRWAEQALDEPAELWGFVRGLGAIVAILGTAIAAMLLAAQVLRPTRQALVFRDRDSLASRAILAGLLLLIRALPILAFALVANALILVPGLDPDTKVSLGLGINAIVLVRIGVALAKALLAPGLADARLIPVSDPTALTLTRSVHWLLAVIVYGHAGITILQYHDLPWMLQGTLARLIGLIVLVMTVAMVLHHRRTVADALTRLAEAGKTPTIPWRRVGAVWHVFPIIYLIALFILYTIQGGELFVHVLARSLLSAAVIVGLAAILVYLEGKNAAAALPPDGPKDDLAGEEAADAADLPMPKQRRHGLLLLTLRLAILGIAIFSFLEVWGFEVWHWLIANLGRAGERWAGIGLVVGLIYLVWLAISSVIGRYIRAIDEGGGTARSSNRQRTALVLARNGLLVTLSIIGALVVLSELGLNIGPLLAGAGVVGIAIGFGSQRLVQDVITGLFALIEDSFAVGDVVDLGGRSGVVEAVTIRTVQLRDVSGSVHTIPFGAIDVVTNKTKDFSFAVFDVGVAYRESVDQVMEVIREVGEGLYRDRIHRRVIMEPLEMLGVDKFGDSAVVIRSRLKVRPGSQWLIGREFNRRLKNRFDQLGIEIPFPHQTIYFGQDRVGTAPPIHVQVEGRPAAAEAGGQGEPVLARTR